MLAKVWQPEIKRQDCLSQNAAFAQGVGGTSGFSFWVCGFSDHRVKI